ADELGIDPARIAIGGASAGGGLAAALAQRLLDEGGTQPVFQLLVYPMLDDRTALRDDVDARHMRMWSPASNRFAWSAYLGADAEATGIRESVVPARRHDLSGLPPAWIGVGTLDLFHDEDVEYALRLREARVPCELTVVPGAFHGFDAVFRRAGVTREFHAEWVRALRAALGLDDPARASG
ncbi:alpha/beta hydrolase fold domain-containing protein, partial [Microbacterium sp. CPCC 204701]|uniref:alpha/beta hydrolase fold domain-containing protein n=1 Tax=Microbacterium sp. CPCC 204701 TaxID=2493084 RepID=UPI0013E36802